jgi:hypothetical protein
MEDVLETYKKPCDKRFPVLCMDEQPVQLLKETRVPIPASKEHARRVDYEYERNGTASIFMFAEPLKGWRQVRARPQRTKVDWALEMKELLTTRFAEAEKVLLVCDNLNTHTKGAFYEAFPSEQARALVQRLEFHYTPKHGSWLNIAENELSCMTRQCLKGVAPRTSSFCAKKSKPGLRPQTRTSEGSNGSSVNGSVKESPKACFAFECMECSHTWVEQHYDKFAADFNKGNAKEDWGENNSCPKCHSADVGTMKETSLKPSGKSCK